MESTAGETSKRHVGEDIMQSWKSFFRMKDGVPEDKKSLYAMGKLVQVALVNYMCLRKVYPESAFTKRSYKNFKFHLLSTSDEEGVKLNEIILSIGKFINVCALKALRFQLFHNPEKPTEIGEEIHFQFYYGNDRRVEMNFGNGDVVNLDLTENTFESFIQCFGEMIGRIKHYCAHLDPLPACEKRFRTSFCKKIPNDFATGPFNIVTGTTCYAPNIQSREIGMAMLPGVATAALLRTCYSNADADKLIDEGIEQALTNELNDIVGEEMHSTSINEVPMSPTFDRHSVTSCEAVFSPFTSRERRSTTPQNRQSTNSLFNDYA